MAQTYMRFDFGADEDKAQEARHKLERWKQAFRLDKKLQYKFDRAESEGAAPERAENEPKPKEKAKKSGKPKPKAKSEASEPEANGTVKLLVRLYFSGHEKLSEQRWLDRIPMEEPFKAAAPEVIHEGEAEFPEVLSRFDSLE